jgi:hypothetical protein
MGVQFSLDVIGVIRSVGLEVEAGCGRPGLLLEGEACTRPVHGAMAIVRAVRLAAPKRSSS